MKELTLSFLISTFSYLFEYEFIKVRINKKEVKGILRL